MPQTQDMFSMTLIERLKSRPRPITVNGWQLRGYWLLGTNDFIISRVASAPVMITGKAIIL